MDSSFLTWANLGLGLYSGIIFLKLVIQFGLPNHPIRLGAYLVSLCVALYFNFLVLTQFGVLSPWFWMKWRTLPLVTGSFFLLIQTVSSVGSMGLLQQKVVSRLPLIAGLLCFTFFPQYADYFVGFAIAAGCAFLTITVGKARYQKRQFFKMTFFLLIFVFCKWVQIYWAYLFGELMLFVALFYFSVFEQAACVASKIDQFHHSLEGASA